VSPAKPAVGSIVLLILTFAFLEGALSLLSIESKTVRLLLTDVPSIIPEPKLRFRLNPDYPDHDEAGFRNPSVPKSSHVVVLGDSQTYGVGVEAGEAWPHQLSELSRESVYNMGVPGYGPVHSVALMNRVLAFHPQSVIEAVYSGNDLWDAYSMTYRGSGFEGLRSTDRAVLSAINNAEAHDNGIHQFSAIVGSSERNQPNVVRRYLARHSSLWGLLRATKAVVNTRLLAPRAPDARWAQAVKEARDARGQLVPFEREPVRTVFTPHYRFAAMDLDDPRIREGLRICIEEMKQLFAITHRNGARFTVVLIPTKELVFFDTFGSAFPALNPLAAAGRTEHEMWDEFKNELRLSGISFVDALPALRDALSVGESPYPADADGHPNARGHRAIAAAVVRHLEALDSESGH
jgi:hypothetical protein